MRNDPGGLPQLNVSRGREEAAQSDKGNDELPKINKKPRKSRRQSSSDDDGMKVARGVTSQWKQKVQAPKCAENISGREKEFLLEAQRQRKARAALEDLWRLSIQAERDFNDAKALKRFREEQDHIKKSYKEHEQKTRAEFEKVRGNVAATREHTIRRKESIAMSEAEASKIRKRERLAHEKYLRDLKQKLEAEEQAKVDMMKSHAVAEMRERERKSRLREEARRRQLDNEREFEHARIRSARERQSKEVQEQVKTVQTNKERAAAKKKALRARKEAEKQARKEEDRRQRLEDARILKEQQEAYQRELDTRKRQIEKEKQEKLQLRTRRDAERKQRIEEEAERQRVIVSEMQREAELQADREAQERANLEHEKRQQAMREKATRDKAIRDEEEAKRQQEEESARALEKLAAREAALAQRQEREMQAKIAETQQALNRKIKWLQKYG